jgi:hypothetical protein
VDRRLKTTSRIVAWLLCGLLVCVAIHSPHCDMCDELFFFGPSSPHADSGHPDPVSHDECNGVCSCCIFQGLPSLTPVLEPAHTVTTGIWIAFSSPLLAPCRSIFRPPRSLISA